MRRVGDVLEHLRAPDEVDARVLERQRAVGLDRAQVGAGSVAARALERRLGDLDADRIGTGRAQRRHEPARPAAEVEHPLSRPRLGEQQRAPALPLPTARGPAARPPRSPRSGVAPGRGYASAWMRLRLIRHATLLVKVAGRLRAGGPDARPGGRATAGPGHAEPACATRSCELPEPAAIVVRGLDAIDRHAPAPGPPRRDRDRAAAEARRPCSASRRTPRRCARTASPTCGRWTTRSTGTASGSPARPRTTAPARSAS